MYGDSLNLQYSNLLYALGAGFVFATLYDVTRFLRVAVWRKKRFLVFIDIIYPLFVGVSTYLVALSVNYGVVRFYIVAGELLGAVVYFITVSGFLFSFFTNIYYSVLNKSRRVLSFALKPLNAVDAKLFAQTEKIASKLKKRTKKMKLFQKIDLKHRYTMLYNKLKYNFFYRMFRMKGAENNEREKKP